MNGDDRWQHVNNTVRQRGREGNQCHWDKSPINLAVEDKKPFKSRGLHHVEPVAHHRLNNTVKVLLLPQTQWRTDPGEASVSFGDVVLLKTAFYHNLSQLFWDVLCVKHACIVIVAQQIYHNHFVLFGKIATTYLSQFYHSFCEVLCQNYNYVIICRKLFCLLTFSKNKG